MQNKVCLLFLVFLLIIVQSISLDSYRRQGKKDNDDNDAKNVIHTGKYNQLDDDSTGRSTYHRHRYPSHGSSSNSYRSRSPWPSLSQPSSPFDDGFDDYNWSPYGYGPNNMLINLPPPFDTGAYLSNGPSCHSLLDPIYPIFSDVCGSVPQARYSLPNAFGHLERWQIAQVLNVLLGPSTPASTNPVCIRSLRLLLCPLLFPPCPTRFEAPPVLPCQPFCRAVKNQCANPSLELLPCDLLPPTSDLCPINPTPYSSLLSSFAPQSPFSGPLPPFGGPQSALSSILAQSAGYSPIDISPSPFSAFSQPPPFVAGIPPPSGHLPLFTTSGLPLPPGMSSFSSPMNPFTNGDPYMANSLTPILVDFPPLQLLQGFPQASRYFPSTRSATEQV